MEVKFKILKIKKVSYVRWIGLGYINANFGNYIYIFVVFLHRCISKRCDVIFFDLPFLGVLHIVHSSFIYPVSLVLISKIGLLAAMETEIFTSFPSLLGINAKHAGLSTSNTEIRGKTHLFIFYFDMQFIGRHFEWWKKKIWGVPGVTRDQRKIYFEVTWSRSFKFME